MRLIKMFGLAAIAVAAVMAFVGASSAMATELEEVVVCKLLQSPCGANAFGVGTKIDSAASDPVLLGPPDWLCEKATFEGKTTTALAHGEITNATWTNCKEVGGGSCTVTTQHTPYLIKGELNSAHTAYEALVTGTTNGRPAWKIVCPEIPGCSFGANTILFEALDVSGVTVLDVLQTLSGEGLCFFTSGVWHAKYTTKCLEGTSEVNCYLEME